MYGIFYIFSSLFLDISSPEHTMLDLEWEFGLEEVPRPVFLTQRGFVRPGLNLAWKDWEDEDGEDWKDWEERVMKMRKDWKVEDGEDEFYFDPPTLGLCLWQQT